MPIRSYPFITMSGLARPQLYVRVSSIDGAKRTEPLLAKVDTGADYCIFPLDIAKELKFEINEDVRKPLKTAGQPTWSYPHKVMLEILRTEEDGFYGSQAFRIPKLTVYFAEESSQFLLGTKGFLDQFILTVDYPKQEFSLRSPPSP